MLYDVFTINMNKVLIVNKISHILKYSSTFSS